MRTASATIPRPTRPVPSSDGTARTSERVCPEGVATSADTARTLSRRGDSREHLSRASGPIEGLRRAHRLESDAGGAMDPKGRAVREEPGGELHQAVRGLGDDYHPFDSVTGAAVEQAEMAKRLDQRLEALAKVAQKANRGGKAQESLAKGKVGIQKLVAAIAWYWTVVRVCVEGNRSPLLEKRHTF